MSAAMSSPSSSPRDVGASDDDLTMGQGLTWVFVAFGLLWPRICIIGFWVFSDMLGDAYGGWLVPVLGFFVLPWTTGAYAMVWSFSSNEVTGLEWALVGLGLSLDLLTWAGTRRLR